MENLTHATSSETSCNLKNKPHPDKMDRYESRINGNFIGTLCKLAFLPFFKLSYVGNHCFPFVNQR